MSDILIQAKVHGDDKVRRMFAMAPGVFRNEYLRWLLKENEMFIGSKRIDGAFRRLLYKYRRWSDKSAWRSQVVNLFRGSVVDPIDGKKVSWKTMGSALGAGKGIGGSGISMELRMGMYYRNQKQIHRALGHLEEGGSISSAKYMPVPVAGRGMVKPYQKFQHWLKSGAFTVVYKGGKAFYFLNSIKDRHKALMFVGYKRTNVRFAHRFRMAFENRKMAILSRGYAATERAAAKVQAMNG